MVSLSNQHLCLKVKGFTDFAEKTKDMKLIFYFFLKMEDRGSRGGEYAVGAVDDRPSTGA